MSEHMMPIPSRLYNAAVGGHVCGPEDVDFGQKVIHLVKYDKAGNEVSFESQVTQANKIYVIHDDFVLSSNVTIPANCVLDFDGGSITGAVNCVLTMNNCYLKGIPKFDTVVFSGDIKNDMFDATWIENGSDIGAKINYAQTYFKRLFVPGGVYLFSTPVVVSELKRLDCRATLKFNGTYKNCEGIFIIKDSSEGVFYFNSLRPNDAATIDRTNSRTLNTVGLEIRSCNANSFVIQNVAWFNENIRVSDIEGRGCCYNTFRIIHVGNGNANVRIYQHDKEGGGASWCNENTFNGGRYAHYTNSYSYGNKYDFVIGGPALDSNTYLPSGITDSYDGINCITIQDCSMEKPWIPVLARNVTGLSILRIDGEQNPKAAKFIGYVRELEINAIYGPGIWSCDFSEVTELRVKHSMGYSEVIDINANRNLINGNYIPYNFDMTNGNGVRTIPYMDTYLSLGRVIDTSSIKLFSLKTDKACRFSIRYLDNNGINITQDYTNKSPLGSFYYHSYGKEWVSSADTTSESVVKIPSEITKVFIGVQKGNASDELIISSINGFPFKTKIISGTTAQRPSSGMPSNMSYYDTDLGKPIWYNGNGTTGWIDATGTAV